MSLGAELRRLREVRDLSQRRVAACAGISAMYLCDLERGNRQPASGETLRALADVLGVEYPLLVIEAVEDRFGVRLVAAPTVADAAPSVAGTEKP